MNSKIREKEVLKATESYIRKVFENEGSGHDWWHIYRVRKLALHLHETEGGNRFVIEMAALLHDLDDWKIKEELAGNRALLWLENQDVSDEEKRSILAVIQEVSFKGAGVETPATSVEAQIVQDADRLDAIGAIGIARTFAYGGNKKRLIYDPDIQPEMHQSFQAYQKNSAPTINHFYEKLLLLKDRMNTNLAQRMAAERHRFMEQFLAQFYDEWEAKI